MVTGKVEHLAEIFARRIGDADHHLQAATKACIAAEAAFDRLMREPAIAGMSDAEREIAVSAGRRLQQYAAALRGVVEGAGQ